MIETTLGEFAAAAGGRLAGPAGPASAVRAVSLDSRDCGPGTVFFAVRGAHRDGQDFAADALARGAAAVVVTRAVAGPHVLVADAVDALGRVAAAHRRSLPDLRVVAVTGSSGKTTTKDLLAAVLEPAGACVSARASYNNELGTPLTVLAADRGTRFLVLELGARAPGHIAALAALSRPNAGVVLNVGRAHLGEFGSQAAIAAAKGELVEAADDYAVLNRDDPLVAAMAARARGGVLTVSAAGHPAADVRALDVRLGADGRASFRLAAASGAVPVTLRLLGAHQVGNALAAAAVGLAEGGELEPVGAALSAAAPRSRWRLELAETPAGIRILNDAYNANPESTAAALRTLATLGGPDRRTVAVLGEMLELGADGPAAHREAGALAAALGIDLLIAVGEAAAPVADGAAGGAGNVRRVPDPAAAGELLAAELQPGDVVLVKASRAVGLELLADRLARAHGVPA